ncbi:hypothetical protein BD410DRAFT_871861 [Rickenella mellea]|uniref:F-box domain-containing protein n=1 Tax=Rickenella mellea TaxID=50990 RepID=A0A4Y7Q179_9AGAM|nr:hypothetical protein BD410DRAFT_871861 [Rickenella mellea]
MDTIAAFGNSQFPDVHRADGKAYAWFPQVLHVCRYLRGISVDCSAIWSYVDTSWPHLVGELLRRSGSTPLTVIVQLNEGEDPKSPYNQAIRLVLEEMHRIKSLQFHGTALHSDLLRLVLPVQAPCLENLVMTSRSLSELPETFFGHPASNSKRMNIKRLFVFNMQVPTQPHVLQNLQYLKINRSRISHPIPNMSSVSQIVGVLGHCQNLIDFEYNDYDDLHMPVADLDTRLAPVALPHLRRIHMTLNANSSVCILGHLIVKTGISIHISGNYVLNSDAPIQPTYLLGCKSIKAEVWGSFFIEPECDMHLDFQRQSYSWEYIFQALPQLFGSVLSQLLKFELDECGDLYLYRASFSEAWKPLLSSFKSLESLSLNLSLSDVAAGFMDALCETNSGQLVCPNLRELTLDIRWPSDPPESVWEKMFLCLRRRNELHSRLATLDISECNRVKPDPEQVRILASLVDALIVPSS